MIQNKIKVGSVIVSKLDGLRSVHVNNITCYKVVDFFFRVYDNSFMYVLRKLPLTHESKNLPRAKRFIERNFVITNCSIGKSYKFLDKT